MEAAVVSKRAFSEIEKRGIEKAKADTPAIFEHLKKLVKLEAEEIKLAFGFAGLVISQRNVFDKDRVLTCCYDKQCRMINVAERAIYLSAYISELQEQFVGLRLPEPKLGAEVVIKREEYIHSK